MTLLKLVLVLVWLVHRPARCVLDLVMAQKDGKYLLVKDPNKAMIRWEST